MDAMINNILAGTSVIIIISVVIAIIMTIFAIRVFWGIFRGAAVSRDLLANGLPAQARILRLGETGMYVNNNPAVDIYMEVTAPNLPPYQVKQRMVVSMLRLAAIQPGAVVPVKYDAGDPNRVVLVM